MRRTKLRATQLRRTKLWGTQLRRTKPRATQLRRTKDTCTWTAALDSILPLDDNKQRTDNNMHTSVLKGLQAEKDITDPIP